MVGCLSSSRIVTQNVPEDRDERARVMGQACRWRPGPVMTAMPCQLLGGPEARASQEDSSTTNPFEVEAGHRIGKCTGRADRLDPFG